MKVRLSGRTSVKVSVVVRVKVSVTVRVSVSVGDERACVYRCRRLICTAGIGLGIGVCMFQHVMRCHITQCILQW